MTDTSLAVRDEAPLPVRMTADDVAAQLEAIEDLMRRAMVKDIDYGNIPGTDKPTLLKPGAEKIGMLFRLRPEFRREFMRGEDGGHLEVITYCSLTHIETRQEWVHEAAGSCSTYESRYRWRKGERLCPTCGVAAIVRNKNGETWQCLGGDKGGCWEKFPIDDPQITEQAVARTENPDPADLHNTVLKMADKRAHVAAILFATPASHVFTQDAEDLPASERKARPKAEEKKADEEKAKAEPKVKTINEAQRKLIFAKAHAKGIDTAAALPDLILAVTQKASTSDLTNEDLQAVLEAIEHYEEA